MTTTRALRGTACLLAVLATSPTLAASQQTLLLRDPTVSDDALAFVYAGDLWITDRDGGDPRRLTTSAANEHNPHFSPDGRHIAFNVSHGSNEDVYVIETRGGTPTRLTWHPGRDMVTGWSSDGARVAFSSPREVGNGRSGQLWEVPKEGGAPDKIMEAPFFRGAWNRGELAYIPFGPAYNGLYGGSAGWKGYRGGTTPSVLLLDPRREHLERVAGERVNDIEPMWDDDTLYFVSDREFEAFNIYRHDRRSGTVTRLTDERPWDVRSADAHDGVIVYEAGGRLKELDLDSGVAREIVVTLQADLPQTRPRLTSVAGNVETVHISRSGKRAIVTARGEVFTVPTKYGSVRNLSRSAGVREYTGLWSPKGERVAWIEQEADGQALLVADQHGEIFQRYGLGAEFHQLEAWSPDGTRIALTDARLNTILLELKRGERTVVDTQERRDASSLAFSPDGRWLAYTKERMNFLADLMLYEIATGTATRVSDGMADVSDLAFSPDGAQLYFAASTNSGPAQIGLDMSSQERPRRVALYALVLAADGDSPLAPRTGDEEEDAEEEEENGDESELPETRIDLDGLADRIVALPIAERNYSDLAVAEDGDLFFVRSVQAGASVTPDGEDAEAENTLLRYDFEERELETLSEGITALELSSDGAFLIARKASGGYVTAPIKDKIELEALDTSGLQLMIDPRTEWAQIFEDAVRMQPAFFYAENMHGLDWAATAARYRALLPHVGRREDLNALIVELIAELQVGHNRAGGGDVELGEDPGAGALLGADFRAENDRWRIVNILTGERWNPFLKAPLARPGLGVAEGDYILAVNGVDLDAGDNLFRHLVGTADRQTTLRIASNPRGRDARDVVVEPIAGERLLRLWDWVERRRERVDAATGGRVGYVYLPNTAGAGYTLFNRMYFAQADREAMIIDERSNGGGQAANYITDVLSRTYLASWKDRDGAVFYTPGSAMLGPKIMLIDQDAGSGGDFLPYAFRREGIGTLMGTRTWGGLIGISRNPAFVDGGRMVVPFFRFFTPDDEWRVENEGVAPDIEVRVDPIAVNRGEDNQLEAAIAEILDQLEGFEDPLLREAPPLPTELGL
ncbi:MAG: PDZ domain-containing protein [Pseudomonadales bacterium]|jgi:tricorn protease|nr:PDZ domain-containing protein [Pseudomonadales bacterium]